MKFVSLLVLAGLAASPILAQTTDLARPLSGTEHPHSMKLKQLDSTWLRLVIKGSTADSGSSDLLGNLARIGLMSQGSTKGQEALGLLGLLGGLGGEKPAVYFTKGATTTIGTETFLIAYTVERKGPDLLQMIAEAEKTGKAPQLSDILASGKWSEDTEASLALVNVRAIAQITGVRPFELAREIAESEKGTLSLMEMMMLGAVSESKEPPPAVAPAPAAPTKPVKKPATKPK